MKYCVAHFKMRVCLEKGLLTILVCDADGHIRIPEAGEHYTWMYHTCEDLNNKLLCDVDSYPRDY